jgi:CHAD domain-containing protein
MQRKQYVRLALPVDLAPECLRDKWNVDIHPQNSRSLVFWDTFEWGLWFGGHVLYSCGDVYRMCALEDSWLGAVLCEEQAGGRRRFWKDFETESMQAKLEGMLGLRGLAPVVEGTFRLRQCDLRNEVDKIVCRLEWVSVSAGKRGEEALLHSCQVLPLLGYEAEAEHVVECLTQHGARTSRDVPLVVLLQHANRVPKRYTLRPDFGLEKDIPAREAVGRIVRAILNIALRNVPGILKDLDTEFLHDYRICLRKTRSLLSLLKDVYPAEGTQRMRKILGDLARQTNRFRDLDVYLLARDEYIELLPPGLRPALDEMFDDFSAERELEVRRVTSNMRVSSSRQLFWEMEEYFSEENTHEPSLAANLPVGPLVFRRIYRRYRKIQEIAAGIGAETPDETVHQIRIECKKLRYLMEFFNELFPKEEVATLQRLLRRLQNRLGEFNDASVQQKSLMSYFEQKKSATEVALGLGGLVSILYHRQLQTRGLIDQALKEFCGGSTAADFKHIFKQPASIAATDIQRHSQK